MSTDMLRRLINCRLLLLIIIIITRVTSLTVLGVTLTTVGAVALLVARRTNDRKVASSRPTKVVCITVLTGIRMG